MFANNKINTNTKCPLEIIIFNFPSIARIMSSNNRNPNFSESVIQIILSEVKENEATIFHRASNCEKESDTVGEYLP